MDIDNEIIKWAKETNQKPLTRTQHNFAKFLFENKEIIAQIGDLNSIFISIRKYLKNNQQ